MFKLRILIIIFLLYSNIYASKKTLKISLINDFKPYSYLNNNKISGFLIDYWELWAKKNNQKIEFIFMSSKQSIFALKNKEIDIHSGIFMSKEFLKSLKYLKTIYPLTHNIYIKKSQDIENLDYKKIAYLKSLLDIKVVEKKFSKSHIIPYENMEDILNDIDNGKIDAFFAEKNKTWYELIKYSQINNYTKIEKNKIEKWMFSAVRRDDKRLELDVLSGISKITNKELLNLEKKWIYEQKLRYFEKQDIKLSQEEIIFINEKKVINYTEIDWKPISIIKNNKNLGLHAEYFKIIEKKTGLKFKYIPSSTWSKSVKKFKDKKVDLIPLVQTFKLDKYIDYEKYGNLSKSFLKFNYVIVTNKEKSYVDSLDDLSFEKIAVPKGYTSYNVIKNLYPNIHVIETKTIKEAMQLVKDKKVYAFLGHAAVSSYYIKNHFPSLQLAGYTDFRFSHHFLVQKDNKILLSILNKVLKTISYEQKHELMHKWTENLIVSSIDYGLIYKIIFIFIFIISITVFFNYELKKNVKAKTKELNKLLSSFDKNVIACKIDFAGDFLYVSEAFCKLTQYKENELLGKNYRILKYKENNASFRKIHWLTIHTKKVFKGEIKNIKKDGTSFTTFSIVTPEYDDKNTFLCYTIVSEDITSQKEVENSKKQIELLNKEIIDTQKEVVFRMGAIAEVRSKETGLHVKRVAEYSKIFALYSNLCEEDAEILKQASPMHDIGKVAIPDNILNKPGKLTKDEFEIMKTHAQIGYEMLNLSDKKILKVASIVAYEHHEKYDGSGYPRGLRGEDIHIYGRITAIADVFDALGSNRCYKKAWSDEKIFELFKNEREKHFDPKLVDIFFKNLDEFLYIRDEFVDKEII